MLLGPLLPSFLDELEKIAGGSLAKKVRDHLAAPQKDWGQFEKNMKSPRFTAEVRHSPEADEKLKAYASTNNAYLRSKKTVLQIPSRTSGKMYSIRELPDGRLGCSCRDWQYKHSWKGSDCAHVKAAKAGLEKSAFVSTLARGAGLAWRRNKAMETSKKGQLSSENVRRIRASMGYR